MKKVLEERDNIVFFIKLLPLKIHPDSYRKAKAIVCERSIWLLERAFKGQNVPAPRCETTEVDDTIELAQRLGISSTPTIILPDGAMAVGFKDAITLMTIIDQAGRAMDEAEAIEAAAEAEAMEYGISNAISPGHLSNTPVPETPASQ